MLLSSVKKILTEKLKSNKKLPEDETMEAYIYESLYYVANKCDPQELVCSPEDTDAPMRLIEDGAFIKIPEYPDLTSTTAHLMIDEALAYAVINHVCFLYTARPDYKAIADDVICNYIVQQGREYYVEI